MPTHPAVIRQQARIAATVEGVVLPSLVAYSHNVRFKGTSAYGPLRRSITVDVEAAAGQNNGTNQIATQDPGVKAALDGAVKEGVRNSLGALV